MSFANQTHSYDTLNCTPLFSPCGAGTGFLASRPARYHSAFWSNEARGAVRAVEVNNQLPGWGVGGRLIGAALLVLACRKLRGSRIRAGRSHLRHS